MNGIKMEDTPTSELMQACHMMQVFMKATADLITDKYSILPEARRGEICRLGSALWDEVCAMSVEAQALHSTLNEPAFLAFKAKLLTKPRRQRKTSKAEA